MVYRLLLTISRHWKHFLQFKSLSVEVLVVYFPIFNMPLIASSKVWLLISIDDDDDDDEADEADVEVDAVDIDDGLPF